MSNEQDRQFSRMSLNVLMLVCIILIIIFAAPQQGQKNIKLPAAPKLNSNVWLSDSGAQVWSNPLLSNTIEIMFWYKAGFGFDGAQKGKANLLAQLLKYQSTQQNLPMDISLDQDFIKVSLHLSSNPASLKLQIDKSVELLYRPQLSQGLLNQLRQHSLSLSDSLRIKAYGHNQNSGPLQGTSETLAQISRADIQKFHQKYLHPKRLFASIVGDLSDNSAQVIMESLLPLSPYQAQAHIQQTPLASSFTSQEESMVLVRQGLLNLNSIEKEKLLVQDYLLLQVLNALQPKQVSWKPGLLNSTFYFQQASRLSQDMQQSADWDMILAAKRQLAQHWIRQTQTATALARHLVALNAYHLPVNHMTKNLHHLQGISRDNWQQYLSNHMTDLAQ